MSVLCRVAVFGLLMVALPMDLAVAQEAQAEPFPTGATIAFVNVGRIAAESEAGKASSARVQALNEEKVVELNTLNEALQASQQKLQQGGTVMSDVARTQLEREIGRLQIDFQRQTEDARVEVQTLQEELQVDFQQRLIPVVQQVAAEKGVQLVLSLTDSGLIWWDTRLGPHDGCDHAVRRRRAAARPTAAVTDWRMCRRAR